MSNRTSWVAFFVVTLIIAFVDGLLTSIGLIALLHADNIFSIIFLIAAGYFTTAMVTFTKAAKSREAPLIVKLLWLISVTLDVYTNILAASFYVIHHYDIHEKFDLTKTRFDPDNLPASILVFGAALGLTGLAVSTLYVAEIAFKKDEV